MWNTFQIEKIFFLVNTKSMKQRKRPYYGYLRMSGINKTWVNFISTAAIYITGNVYITSERLLHVQFSSCVH